MVEFRLLGTLSLTTADGREAGSLLSQPRRLALLAYLAAATPRGPHRRDTLLALFWPELDQEHARAALRQSLHVLRSALGADAMVSRGDEEIGLDFERIWCDVAAFARAIDGGELGQALDLYRGNLLEGFFISDAPEFERWLESERAKLARWWQERFDPDEGLTLRDEVATELDVARQEIARGDVADWEQLKRPAKPAAPPGNRGKVHGGQGSQPDLFLAAGLVLRRGRRARHHGLPGRD